MPDATRRYWEAAPGSEEERAAWEAMSAAEKLAHWFLRRFCCCRRNHGVA